MPLAAAEEKKLAVAAADDDINQHNCRENRSSSVIVPLKWNDIEDQFDSTRKNLQSIEHTIKYKLKQLANRESELAAIQNVVDEKIREVNAREERISREIEERERSREEFNSAIMEREIAIRVLEREISERERKCERIFDELRLRETEIEEEARLKARALKRSLMEIESKERKIEEERRELRLREEEIVERCRGEVEKKCRMREEEIVKWREEVEKEFKTREQEIVRRWEEVDKEFRIREQEIVKWRKEVDKEFRTREEEIVKRRKEVEKEFGMREKEIGKRYEEIELKRKEFGEEFRVNEEEIKKHCGEVELKEKEVEGRCKEVELKEKELNGRRRGVELKERMIERKWKEIELKERRIEGWCKEIKFKEKEVEGRCREVESSEKMIGGKCKEIELKEKRVEGWCKELELKEKLVEGKCKQLELKEKIIEGQCKEIKLKEKKIEGKCKELELKEKRIEGQCKDLELKDKRIEGQCKEIEFKEKGIEGRCKDLELKEKRIEGRCKDLELKEKRIEGQCKELELQEKLIEGRCKELELKDKELDGQFKEVEVKERKFVGTLNTQVKSMPLDDNVTDHPSANVSLCFSVKMDGKDLQIFLNERWKEHDSLRNEVAVALQISQDPAKLILGAMQGFYPPFLKKGEVEFEEDVVRKSCILLLEQLMKMSTEIKPHVKIEARKLAYDWKAKMRVDAQHSLEVLGFLQLLASYELSTGFDSDELLNHLEIVAHYGQAPKLLHVLGLADKISGFVQRLLRKKQIDAIKFIYAFELVSEYPPVAFLQYYLKCSRDTVRRITKGDKSLETRVETANIMLTTLRAVLRCIEDHKIEFDLSPEKLKEQIDYQEKKKSSVEFLLPTPGCKDQSPFLNMVKGFSPKVAAVVTPVPAHKSVSTASPILKSSAISSATAPASKTSSPGRTSIKRPWTAVSAEDDPSAFVGLDSGASSDLLQLDKTIDSLPPSSHPVPKYTGGDFSKSSLCKLESSDSLHGENSMSLTFVRELADYVLAAIKSFYYWDLERGKDFKLSVSAESFMFSLKQLRKASPQIQPHVKEKALNFAADWNGKLKKRVQGQWEVVLFVEFLATYGLASSFVAEGFLSLLLSNFGPEKTIDLCQMLGLVDVIHDFIKSLIKSNQRIAAIKYIYALKMDDKFPSVSLLRDHVATIKKTAKRARRRGKRSIKQKIESIHRELVGLGTAINCIESYRLESEFSPAILRERILQRQKLMEEIRKKRDPPKTEKEIWTRSKSNLLQQHPEMKSPNCCLVASPVTASSVPIAVVSSSPTIAPTACPTSPIMVSPSTQNAAAAATPSRVASPSSTGTLTASAITITSTSLPATTTETLVTGMTLSQTPGSTASASASPPSTISPPSGTFVQTQPQHHVQNKRCRVAVSLEPPLKASFGETIPSTTSRLAVVDSVPQFYQQPAAWLTNHEPYTAAAHYSLDGHPPTRQHSQLSHSPIISHLSTNPHTQSSDNIVNPHSQSSHPSTNPHLQLSHPMMNPKPSPPSYPNPQLGHPPTNPLLSHPPTNVQLSHASTNPQLSHPTENLQPTHTPTILHQQLGHPPTNPQPGHLRTNLQLSHPPINLLPPNLQPTHPPTNPQPSHPQNKLQMSHPPTHPMNPQMNHPPTNPLLSHPPTIQHQQLSHPPTNLQVPHPQTNPQMGHPPTNPQLSSYYSNAGPYYHENNLTSQDYVSSMPMWRP